MAILITGGCGYIGSHTCIELIKAGCDIVVIDNYYNSKPEALRRTRELAGRDFPFYECDIRDREGLRRVFAAHPIDAVIHFAGLKAVGESVHKPLERTGTGLMPYITQTAAGIRRELTVFGNDYPTPDGTGVRDYIHVVDLARGHAAALDYSRSHPGWEAINLGTGRGSSVLEIVETFQRVNGVAVPHRIGPRRPGDLPTCYAATDKAARLLHWHAA